MTPPPDSLIFKLSASFCPEDFDPSDEKQTDALYQKLSGRDLPDAPSAESFVTDWDELDDFVSDYSDRLYVRTTCHTDDEEVQKEFKRFISNIMPMLERWDASLSKKLIESEGGRQLDESRFGLYLRSLKNKVELFREESIPLMTELEKHKNEFNRISGRWSLKFEGKELTIPQARVFLRDPDRKRREAVYRAINDRQLEDCDALDDLFEKMFGLRHQMALNAGFGNYRDYRFRELERFDYTPEECEKFHQAILECAVPIATRLSETRRKSLGLDTLRPWDTEVDVKSRDALRPFNTTKELVDRCEEVFQNLDGELGTFFSYMKEQGLLDLDSRKGKTLGGYMTTFAATREPFIFMNAASSVRDVTTLLHEGGHSFHFFMARDLHPAMYRHISHEFSEVASMSMELLSLPLLGTFYDEPSLKRVHQEQIERTVGIFPSVAVTDAFQHWAYTHPEHTRKERHGKWSELTRTYQPDLDYEGLEDYLYRGWQFTHIMEVPFYYIEYAIAQMGALTIWSQSLDNPEEALKRYKKTLALGGTVPLPKAFEAIGMDFDLSSKTLKPLMKLVSAELAKLKD